MAEHQRDDHQGSGQDDAGQRALQGALHLAARGYVLAPVTIVRTADGKKDARFHGRWSVVGSSDPAVIRDWGVQYPGCSFAIDCGASGVEVVDLDLAEGGPAHWATVGYPVPEHVVDTPSGGQHHYWRRPAGDRLINNAGKVAPGVDARTVGGVVFAPGSYVVGVDGQPERRPYAARVELPEPSHLAATPAPVLALWRRSKPAASAPAAVPALGNTPAPGIAPARVPDPTRAYTPEEAASWVGREAMAPLLAAEYGTNVNDTINRAALVLGHFVPEFWPEVEARAMLRSWVLDGPGARNGWHELDKADRDSIDSGLRRGMAEPYAVRTAPGSNPLPPVNGAPVAALGSSTAGLDPFVDLGPHLRGEVVPATPTLGLARARDGLRMIYPGLAHLIFAGTEAGKSWLALAHTAAEIEAGQVVVYVHAEEASPAGTIERLRLLGLSDEQITQGLRFVALEGPLGATAVDLIAQQGASLVVVDGFNEALTAHGLEIMKPDGPSTFRRLVVAPLLAAGAAVLILDHLSKDDLRNGGATPFGSVHKINVADGPAFMLEVDEAFGRGRRGAARLYVTKDRPGHLRRHGEPTKTPGKFFLGVMAVESRDGEPFSLTVWPPVPAAEREQNEAFADEKVMAKAVELIQGATGGQVNQKAVCDAVGGRKDYAVKALDRLVAGGQLWSLPGGRGKPTLYGLPTCSQDQSE